MTKISIGQKLSPVLSEVESLLLDHAALNGSKPDFTAEAFRAAIYIFSTALQDKVWELQEKESFTMEDRINMVTCLGNSIRNLVKTYTDIDTFDLYK